MMLKRKIGRYAMAALVSLFLVIGLLGGCASRSPIILQDDDETVNSAATSGSTDSSSSSSSTEESGEASGTQGTDSGSPDSSDGKTSATTQAAKPTSPGVRPAVAQVKTMGGMPRLFIDGKMETGNLFFINGDLPSSNAIYKSEVGYCKDAGVHMYSVNTNLNFRYTASSNPALIYSRLCNELDVILDTDPKAKILLRVNTAALASDLENSDPITFTDGTAGARASIGSEEWIREATKRMADLVRYVRSQPKYAGHVYGYHLEHNEWFSLNFTKSPDVSEDNSAGFRAWLTKKYGTDAKLQAAWGSTANTLKTAKVPADLPINNGAADGLLLDKTDTRFVDYYDYWNELTASRIEVLGKAVKQASNNENIVITFYGYYFEQYHASTGHWDMRSLLKSPYVDGFASPTSYMDRNAGKDSTLASSGYMSTVDSVARNGKLWVMESDQYTFINRTEEKQDALSYPLLKTIGEIQTVHKREMGIAMMHGTTMYPMDLVGYGWYDYDEIWTHFSSLDRAYAAYATAQKTLSTFDVAVVVDEKAQSLVGSAWNVAYNSLGQMMLNMYRTGLSFSLVELQDVLDGKVDDAKMYLFVNPYRLSSSVADTLASRLHRDGKTSIFLYTFGQTAAADMQKLTGMQMKTEDRVTDHAITLENTMKIPGFSALGKVTSNPVTTVTGGYTAALGRYTDGGMGFAMKETEDWRAIFIGTNGLSVENIRALAAYSGCTLYTDTGDILVANQNMVVLNTVTSGNKIVRFDKAVDVYDYFAGKWYTGVRSVTFEGLTKGTCKWLYYGKKADIEAMKLPKWE